MADQDLELRTVALERALSEMQGRNQRVELDKAWETSKTRRGVILILTYVIASLALSLIGVVDYWKSALIPTVGYLLSTLSVSFVKARWMRHWVAVEQPTEIDDRDQI